MNEGDTVKRLKAEIKKTQKHLEEMQAKLDRLEYYDDKINDYILHGTVEVIEAWSYMDHPIKDELYMSSVIIHKGEETYQIKPIDRDKMQLFKVSR